MAILDDVRSELFMIVERFRDGDPEPVYRTHRWLTGNDA